VAQKDATDGAIAHAVETANRLGFLLLKEFFAVEEVRRWEATAVGLSAEERKQDFLTLGCFDSLLFHPRVLALARGLLGPELVYYGETNCVVDGAEPFRLIHSDARGMPGRLEAFHEPEPGQVFPGWRFAVYFRDYAAGSGGLKVLPESHLAHPFALLRIPQRTVQYKVRGHILGASGPAVQACNVPSVPGDLVIFNLALQHAAGFVRLLDDRDAVLFPPTEIALLKDYPWLAEPQQVPRNALFFDYGAPSVALDLYIKWRAHRTFKDGGDTAPELAGHPGGFYRYDAPGKRAIAAKHGVTLRYDRIIEHLLRKQKSTGTLSPPDRARLDDLFALNREFSDHFPLRALAG
jgi:hypothetical protein